MTDVLTRGAPATAVRRPHQQVPVPTCPHPDRTTAPRTDPDFRSVAQAVTSRPLLLQPAASAKQQCVPSRSWCRRSRSFVKVVMAGWPPEAVAQRLHKLSPAHHRAVALRVAGEPPQAIVQALGVQLRTVYVWFSAPLVKAEVERRSQEVDRLVNLQLTNLTLATRDAAGRNVAEDSMQAQAGGAGRQALPSADQTTGPSD